MKKKRVLKIIRRYYNRLDKKSRQMSTGYAPKVIHQFRTKYKQLKAFLHMVHVPGIPGKLKAFYHQLGILRDLQLQEQYTRRDARHLPTYRKIIHKQAEQSKLQLAGLLVKKPLKKARKKTLKAVKSGFSNKRYQRYLESQTAAVQEVLQPVSYSDTHLHTIRKLFKELSNNEQLKQSPLQDKLGAFQDKRNTLRLFRQYHPARMAKKERIYIEKKEKALVAEKKTLKAQLIKELKSIV